MADFDLPDIGAVLAAVPWAWVVFLIALVVGAISLLVFFKANGWRMRNPFGKYPLVIEIYTVLNKLPTLVNVYQAKKVKEGNYWYFLTKKDGRRITFFDSKHFEKLPNGSLRLKVLEIGQNQFRPFTLGASSVDDWIPKLDDAGKEIKDKDGKPVLIKVQTVKPAYSPFMSGEERAAYIADIEHENHLKIEQNKWAQYLPAASLALMFVAALVLIFILLDKLPESIAAVSSAHAAANAPVVTTPPFGG